MSLQDRVMSKNLVANETRESFPGVFILMHLPLLDPIKTLLTSFAPESVLPRVIGHVEIQASFWAKCFAAHGTDHSLSAMMGTDVKLEFFSCRVLVMTVSVCAHMLLIVGLKSTSWSSTGLHLGCRFLWIFAFNIGLCCRLPANWLWWKWWFLFHVWWDLKWFQVVGRICPSIFQKGSISLFPMQLKKTKSICNSNVFEASNMGLNSKILKWNSTCKDEIFLWCNTNLRIMRK